MRRVDGLKSTLKWLIEKVRNRFVIPSREPDLLTYLVQMLHGKSSRRRIHLRGVIQILQVLRNFKIHILKLKRVCLRQEIAALLSRGIREIHCRELPWKHLLPARQIECRLLVVQRLALELAWEKLLTLQHGLRFAEHPHLPLLHAQGVHLLLASRVEYRRLTIGIDVGEYLLAIRKSQRSQLPIKSLCAPFLLLVEQRGMLLSLLLKSLGLKLRVHDPRLTLPVFKRVQSGHDLRRQIVLLLGAQVGIRFHIGRSLSKSLHAHLLILGEHGLI